MGNLQQKELASNSSAKSTTTTTTAAADNTVLGIPKNVATNILLFLIPDKQLYRWKITQQLEAKSNAENSPLFPFANLFCGSPKNSANGKGKSSPKNRFKSPTTFAAKDSKNGGAADNVAVAALRGAPEPKTPEEIKADKAKKKVQLRCTLMLVCRAWHNHIISLRRQVIFFAETLPIATPTSNNNSNTNKAGSNEEDEDGDEEIEKRRLPENVVFIFDAQHPEFGSVTKQFHLVKKWNKHLLLTSPSKRKHFSIASPSLSGVLFNEGLRPADRSAKELMQLRNRSKNKAPTIDEDDSSDEEGLEQEEEDFIRPSRHLCCDLSKCSSIQTLSLNRVNVTNEWLGKTLSRMSSSLKELEMKFLPKRTLNTPALTRAGLISLERLQFQYMRHDPAWVNTTLSRFNNLTCLQVIDSFEVKNSENADVEIPCLSLRKLEIENGFLTDRWINEASAGNNLSHLTLLKDLRLQSRDAISAPHIRNDSVTRLKFSMCTLLSEPRIECKNLTVLIFDNCGITDNWFEHKPWAVVEVATPPPSPSSATTLTSSTTTATPDFQSSSSSSITTTNDVDTSSSSSSPSPRTPTTPTTPTTSNNNNDNNKNSYMRSIRCHSAPTTITTTTTTTTTTTQGSSNNNNNNSKQRSGSGPPTTSYYYSVLASMPNLKTLIFIQCRWLISPLINSNSLRKLVFVDCSSLKRPRFQTARRLKNFEVFYRQQRFVHPVVIGEQYPLPPLNRYQASPKNRKPATSVSPAASTTATAKGGTEATTGTATGTTSAAAAAAAASAVVTSPPAPRGRTPPQTHSLDALRAAIAQVEAEAEAEAEEAQQAQATAYTPQSDSQAHQSTPAAPVVEV